jgi:small subunit ribosomal protein S1
MMADDPTNNDNPESNDEPEENFAEMFEAYSAGMKEDLRVGDKLKTRIIAISDSNVFVDTGTKTDGVVEIEELKDENGQLPYAVGDELELFVITIDESEVRLTRAITGLGGLDMLKGAYSGHIPVEGRVVQSIKGGFQVDVLKRRAFCPISQIDTSFVENPELYVGKTFQFMIKKLTENGRNIVLSRRDLLEAEQKKAQEEFLQTLDMDKVFTGRVTRIMPYGAFVELSPGLEGMVHISELSWSRLEKTEDAVQVGQQIQVKVLRVEPGKRGKKISLSVKQAQGDPWDQLAATVQPGQTITGKVTRCADFGAFVQIQPGIEGLVHISEMSFTQRVHKASDLVSPGQMISVVVKEIDIAKRRIGLSIREAEGDPWQTIESKFSAGQPVDGTVEKQERFGIFVQLEPGIVGLLPKSAISRSPSAAQIEKLKPGEAIAVTIETVNAAERKISLKPRDAEDEEQWQQFKTDPGKASMGALGEQLAKVLNKKEEK